MRPDLLKTIAKGLVGFLLGLALWAGFINPYARLVASAVNPLFLVMEKRDVTTMVPNGSHLVINRIDFKPGSSKPGLPLLNLTFNFIALTALFAASPSPLSTRNISAFAISCLLLSITHVFSVFVKVQAIYARELGEWSRLNYTALERDLWVAGAHFNQLVGVNAVAFLLWWLLKPQAESPPATESRSEGSQRPRRKAKKRSRR